jgi:hypothetical protein
MLDVVSAEGRDEEVGVVIALVGVSLGAVKGKTDLGLTS